jgi:hypothetical protein
MGKRIKKVKVHLRENKAVYISAGITIVTIAGITWTIMRGANAQSISRDVIVTAGRDAIVTRKKIVLHGVSFISSDRQGPPSWVVRCKETGAIFTSQRAAALAMGITESNLSRYLNGLQDSAQGYTFERVCLAA